jgi:hypothetical protein
VAMPRGRGNFARNSAKIRWESATRRPLPRPSPPPALFLRGQLLLAPRRPSTVSE